MTTSLGIAATTAVLRGLLQNAIPAADLVGLLGPITVSALPPDRIDVTAETARLNLFMYQVKPNAGWSNNEFPWYDATGHRITNPPLALDLSYMLSAYGSKDFHSEILLGYGALVLHHTRVLTRDLVKQTFTGGALPPDLALLSTADLDGQEELVSLSMEPMSVDDLSRLWQVFGEKYRPSIAFQAHVVLLRGPDPAAASGPPVQRLRLSSTTSINPSIDAVDPTAVTLSPGATIDLVGTGLLVPGAVAQFGSGETAAPTVDSTVFRVTVPLPGTLLAGVNMVRMELPSQFESDLRGGPESNIAPFTLRPAFTPKGGNPPITFSAPVVSGDLTSTTLTVTLVPSVGRRQAVTLLLNEFGTAPGAVPHSYSVNAPSREDDPTDPTDTIKFALTWIQRAKYLVRVRVDGAETDLDRTGELYDGPLVDLS
jgi:hypothetical protein